LYYFTASQDGYHFLFRNVDKEIIMELIGLFLSIWEDRRAATFTAFGLAVAFIIGVLGHHEVAWWVALGVINLPVLVGIAIIWQMRRSWMGIELIESLCYFAWFICLTVLDTGAVWRLVDLRAGLLTGAGIIAFFALCELIMALLPRRR